MTLVNHIDYNDVIVAIGDGGDPETFAPKCTMNAARTLNMSADMSSRVLPDCSDDTVVGATLNYATAYNCEVSGSGVLELGDDKFFADWLMSGEAKNCKVDIGGTGGTRYEGAFKCQSFQAGGESKNAASGEISLISHGAVAVSAIA